jgi:transcriptional regulator with XRE-family HTH domain
MKISPLNARSLGLRIRRLRESKGLSRAALAAKLKADISSVAGWESGQHLPRDTMRAKLARTLECSIDELMSPVEDAWEPARVSLIDVNSEFPALFAEHARKAKSIVRATRLASPYPTTVNVQTEARQILSDRLLRGTLTLQRVEIIYRLDRLKEIVSNILRYDGCSYYVRAYCVGMNELTPSFGVWCFDDTEIFAGGYWSGYPPIGQPVMRISGEPVKRFFLGYWNEVWSRGTFLNAHGAQDLSALRDTALRMGLEPRQWKRFVEEARALQIGDGAPPVP